MIVNLSVDLAEFTRRVDEIGQRARDLKLAFDGPIDTFVTQLIADRFDAEGAAWGGDRWAALTLRTLNRRKKAGRGRGGILYDTGRLRGSLVTGSGEGFKTSTATRYLRGTTVPYAQYHNVKSGRPIFVDPAPAVVTDRLVDILTRYILDDDLSGG